MAGELHSLVAWNDEVGAWRWEGRHDGNHASAQMARRPAHKTAWSVVEGCVRQGSPCRREEWEWSVASWGAMGLGGTTPMNSGWIALSALKSSCRRRDWLCWGHVPGQASPSPPAFRDLAAFLCRVQDASHVYRRATERLCRQIRTAGSPCFIKTTIEVRDISVPSAFVPPARNLGRSHVQNRSVGPLGTNRKALFLNGSSCLGPVPPVSTRCGTQMRRRPQLTLPWRVPAPYNSQTWTLPSFQVHARGKAWR